MSKIPDEAWQRIQDKTGTNILGIVMRLIDGRASASETMDKISEHCEAAYEEGEVK